MRPRVNIIPITRLLLSLLISRHMDYNKLRTPPLSVLQFVHSRYTKFARGIVHSYQGLPLQYHKRSILVNSKTDHFACSIESIGIAEGYNAKGVFHSKILGSQVAVSDHGVEVIEIFFNSCCLPFPQSVETRRRPRGHFAPNLFQEWTTQQIFRNVTSEIPEVSCDRWTYTLCRIHWWQEVISSPNKSNAKSFVACQNLSPIFSTI